MDPCPTGSTLLYREAGNSGMDPSATARTVDSCIKTWHNLRTAHRNTEPQMASHLWILTMKGALLVQKLGKQGLP